MTPIDGPNPLTPKWVESQVESLLEAYRKGRQKGEAFEHASTELQEFVLQRVHDGDCKDPKKCVEIVLRLNTPS
jgi:hypothetical protein